MQHLASSTFDRWSPQSVGQASTCWYYVFHLNTLGVDSQAGTHLMNYLCVRGPDMANEH